MRRIILRAGLVAGLCGMLSACGVGGEPSHPDATISYDEALSRTYARSF